MYDYINDEVKTDWYPYEIKPVRIGYYERKYQSAFNSSIPDYWDGEDWHHGVLVLDKLTYSERITEAEREWRGIKFECKYGE